MQIALIDVDSHNFPNLCLMKLSAYHKKQGDTVEWWNGFKQYDIVYKRRVFTDEYSFEDKTVIQAEKIIYGGTGYGLKNALPKETEHCYPDYSIYPKLKQNTAYGFLTRGCPHNCPFCIVSQKEGLESKKWADLDEFWKGQKFIKLLDPNLLACQEQKELLNQLVQSRAWIDITQGLDARFIHHHNIDLLEKLKIQMIHFAFDSMKDEKQIVQGLTLYKEATQIDERKTGVYILTNYNTTHKEDIYRVQVVQNLGYHPYIMVYQKHSAPKITRDLQRWSNNRYIYAATKGNFKNYNY